MAIAVTCLACRRGPSGRNRWCEMKTNGGTDWGHDASQIPAEWHGWLHHMSDPNPVETKPLGQELADYGAAAPVAYEIKHIKNPTGSEDKYLPPWHRMSESVRAATSVRTLVYMYTLEPRPGSDDALAAVRLRSTRGGPSGKLRLGCRRPLGRQT